MNAINAAIEERLRLIIFAIRKINMKNWEIVTKDELMKFVKGYPCKLDEDYYMDTYTWNDFRDGRVFPESIVAIIDAMDEDCRICKDYI